MTQATTGMGTVVCTTTMSTPTIHHRIVLWTVHGMVVIVNVQLQPTTVVTKAVRTVMNTLSRVVDTGPILMTMEIVVV